MIQSRRPSAKKIRDVLDLDAFQMPPEIGKCQVIGLKLPAVPGCVQYLPRFARKLDPVAFPYRARLVESQHPQQVIRKIAQDRVR